jgi:hypothetical protein
MTRVALGLRGVPICMKNSDEDGIEYRQILT